jgi:hypothetical protein
VAGTVVAQHDHGIGVPVTFGPLLLRVVLLIAVCAVAGFALLRGFLPTPERSTLRWVAVLAPVAVVLELMLAGGFALPSQVAVLALGLLFVPGYLAISQRDSDPARRAVPFVLALTAGLALVQFGRAWLGGGPEVLLHTGLIVAVTGLSWLTVGLPRPRLARVGVLALAYVLATAVLAGAAQATVAQVS